MQTNNALILWWQRGASFHGFGQKRGNIPLIPDPKFPTSGFDDSYSSSRLRTELDWESCTLDFGHCRFRPREQQMKAARQLSAQKDSICDLLKIPFIAAYYWSLHIVASRFESYSQSSIRRSSLRNQSAFHAFFGKLSSVLVLILINESHFCEDRDIPRAILNH